MKETIAVSALLLATVCLFSCGEKKQPEDGGSFWEQFGVVADREVINGDTVIVFDSGMVKQRSTVPVELLVDGFEVVKMDNSKEDALIGGRLTLVGISSNYIGVHHYQFFAFKLFDKDGRYLRDIGSIGQGPGEYNAIQDCYMDEENDRIYLLTGYNSTEVLVYDFNGNHYPPVRLAPSCNVSGGSKMKLRPGKDEIIFTRSLVGRGTGFYHVWVQDWDGNFIQGIRDTEYYPERANSESTTTHLHTENVELFRLGSNNAEDYLYHYDRATNRLIPQFKMKNWDENTSFIYELPHHYVIEAATFTGFESVERTTEKVIIDKATLRGCYWDGFDTPYGIVLDQYDMLFKMHEGNFTLLDFGSFIQERIDRVDREKLPADKRLKLETLEKMIREDGDDGEDDCSLLFRGKFKR